MIRVVNPLQTFVPWGARLKYTKPESTNRSYAESRAGNEHVDIHYLRMQGKKEQISEQVAKGMQYLAGIGQAVTNVLANFGIDSSYEIHTDDHKHGLSAGEKPPPSAPAQTQADRKPNEGSEQQKSNESQPVPVVLSRELPQAGDKFDNLKKVEERYRSAAANINVGDQEDHLASTISSNVRWRTELRVPESLQWYLKNSHSSEHVNRSEVAATGTNDSNVVMNVLYPIVTPVEEVPSASGFHVSEDQIIANRLIEMGFSADEVFRVIKMHGENFEKCIEEMLKKPSE
uniref:UBA domain-containing protein n=1 Tax=Angiostrongylus cantonensis TaxID=6313 RepID=A0A0K0DR98_ANGCA